jgi:hypothetical protein
MEQTTIEKGKRTKPFLKKHRVAIELTTTPSACDKLVAQAVKRYGKMLEEQKAWMDWVHEKVIVAIIEASNAKLEPADQTDTLTLYSTDGEYKFTVERQLKKFVDARAEMAKAKIEDWLREYESKTIQADDDSALIYDFLKKMFFGSKLKQFRWTPQLMDFITMDPARIHDKRLKEAQALLKESIRVDRSKWYSHVYKYDEAENEYKKMEV